MRAGVVTARDEAVLPASPAFAIASIAAVVSSEPFTPAGSASGPDDDEVVVHDVLALLAEAVRDELLLVGLGVHEQDVGVLVLAELERLAGTDGDDLDLVLGLAFSNAGISTSNSPESCVDVVEARTTSLVWGRLGGGWWHLLRTPRSRETSATASSMPASCLHRGAAEWCACASPFHREAGTFPCPTLSARAP